AAVFARAGTGDRTHGKCRSTGSGAGARLVAAGGWHPGGKRRPDVGAAAALPERRGCFPPLAALRVPGHDRALRGVAVVPVGRADPAESSRATGGRTVRPRPRGGTRGVVTRRRGDFGLG